MDVIPGNLLARAGSPPRGTRLAPTDNPSPKQGEGSTAVARNEQKGLRRRGPAVEGGAYVRRRASMRSMALCASPRSVSSSASVNERGSLPITQSVPSALPVDVTSGMPA